MGYTHHDEEDQRPSAEEETLPLYTEESQFHLPSTLQPPDPKATPDEVRDFLVQVMQARGLGTDHARRVAARWTLGTGRELRTYPVGMFVDIFGHEDAWIVYKEVRVLFYKQENSKKFPRWGWVVCLLSTLFLLVLSFAIIVNEDNDDWDDDDSWGAIVPAFAGVGLLVGIIGSAFSFAMSLGPEDPEARAERELNSLWVSKPANAVGQTQIPGGS